MKKVKNTNNFTPISDRSITDFLSRFEIFLHPLTPYELHPKIFPNESLY